MKDSTLHKTDCRDTASCHTHLPVACSLSPVASSRRHFLRSATGGAALLSLGLDAPSFLARSVRAAESAKSTDRVLVVLQLSGGNDGLNTVVPHGDDLYHKNRPLLRIAPGSALKINDHLGLHPNLGGLQKLLEEQRLAIVQGVGYPQPDRSHFRSMDIWHSAQPENLKPADGWLGRAVERDDSFAGRDVPALHLGGNRLPLALVSTRRPLPSVDSLENFRLRGTDGSLPIEALRQLADVSRPGEESLLSFMQRSTVSAFDSSKQVQAVLSEQKSAVNYPGFGLAKKLQSVAQLIDAGLSTRIYYVSLDGFDTHAAQAPGHGALMSELASSVKAFIDDLAARSQLDRVVLLVFSEFGRRLHENASAGTDHGAAAPVLLAGSRVASGLIGEHPSLKDLDNEGDIKFHTDFRRVYATVLDGWLGWPSQQILGGKFEAVKVLKDA